MHAGVLRRRRRTGQTVLESLQKELEHFSKSCSHIVISTAGRDLRLRDNQGVRISPCGRDDRMDKPTIVKRKKL